MRWEMELRNEQPLFKARQPTNARLVSKSLWICLGVHLFWDTGRVMHHTRQMGHWYSMSISGSPLLPVPEDATDTRDSCSTSRIAASFACTA
jgi:hypothetical protein